MLENDKMFKAHIMSDLHLEMQRDFGAQFLASLIHPTPPGFSLRLIDFLGSLQPECPGVDEAIEDEEVFDEELWMHRKQGEAELLLSDFRSAHRQVVQALILAGDIVGFGQFNGRTVGSPGAYRIAEWQLRFLCCLYQKVFYVPGNHEFWEFKISKADKLLDRLVNPVSDNFPISNLEVLRPGTIVNFGGHQLLGGTMWFSTRTKIMWGPTQTIEYKDYSVITDLNNVGFQHNDNFVKCLSKDLQGLTKAIVVSHHLPSKSLLHDPHTPEAPYFYTEMENIIKQWQPAAWIFGHDHILRLDQMFQDTKTRIISHPHGDPEKLVRGFDSERIFAFP